MAKRVIRKIEAIDFKNYLPDEFPDLNKLLVKEKSKLLIGQLVSDLRKEVGLDQDQLAALTGTTESVISQVESADYDGESAMEILRRLCMAMNREVRVIQADPSGRITMEC